MTGDRPVTGKFQIFWNHTDNLTMWTGNLHVHLGWFRIVFDGFLVAGWIFGFCFDLCAVFCFVSLGFFCFFLVRAKVDFFRLGF